jgi:Zn-dependent peptidase ImmA (M78 family)
MPTTAGRVRDLIQASGLNQRDFAQRIGLDESKLSKSLGGTRRLSSLDLARIAELCDVTVDWLITGEEPPLALAARTTGGRAGTAVKAAKRYSTLRSDITALGYPQPWRAPTTNLDGGTWAEQGERLAAAASKAIAQAGRTLTDENLPDVIEQVFGADVAAVDLGTDFDGLAVSSPAAKVIVLATSHVPARQRFTLAHELGHLLAGDDQDVHLDRDVYDKTQSKDPSEQRANTFAAAFLMPAETLTRAVGTTGLTEAAFATLACELAVSPSALAIRLLKLRLIDSGSCDRYTRISAAKAANLAGRGEELARRTAAAATPRAPGLLVRDTYTAYEEGKATLRPYAALIGVETDALRDALESGNEVRGEK